MAKATAANIEKWKQQATLGDTKAQKWLGNLGVAWSPSSVPSAASASGSGVPVPISGYSQTPGGAYNPAPSFTYNPIGYDPEKPYEFHNAIAVNAQLTPWEAADPLSRDRSLYQGKLNQLASGGPDLYGFGQYQKSAMDELTGGYQTVYEGALQNLTTDPRSLENLGAYKFAKDQGMQAIERKAAAMGTSLGSGTAKDLAKYTSGLASSTYFDMFGALQGALGTAYQGMGSKISGYGGLATRGLEAYQGQMGAMKALTEGNAIETAKLRSLEQQQANELFTNWQIAKNQKAKKASGSGWGSALGTIAGGIGGWYLSGGNPMGAMAGASAGSRIGSSIG